MESWNRSTARKITILAFYFVSLFPPLIKGKRENKNKTNNSVYNLYSKGVRKEKHNTFSFDASPFQPFAYFNETKR